MELVRTIFGSKLYGTANENSDNDFKSVFLASMEDIVLGKDVETILSKTNNQRHVKNAAGDVDYESKELRSFIRKGCLGGQTYALDMLFTPRDKWITWSPIWKDIVRQREHLVTKNIAPFMGYCRGQANKYSTKGDKLRELIEFQQLLAKHPKTRLSQYITENDFQPEYWDHVNVFKKETAPGRFELYIRVNESEYPLNRSTDDVKRSVDNKVDEYGDRSRKALEDSGVDLKAYYHAFRIAWELEELLTKKEITFPSDKVHHLVDIRNRVYQKDYIVSWLNEEIARIFELPNNLPEPDVDYWNEWLLDRYLPNRKLF